MAQFERFQQAPAAKVTAKSSTGKVFIDYRNVDGLRKMMSPNGKIYGPKRTGLNAYEQRLLAQAIKRARYMALLPYTSATL
jgi:small subunit ribosomal protein S18